jgi:purine-binding chemotaxis protein CheW
MTATDSTTKAVSNSAVNGIQSIAGKYLTFTLGNECYGVAVLKVREIIRLTTITSVAQMPPYVRGVINLRGKIIPVIDLRLRLGLADTASTDQTCIIVVQGQFTEGKTAHVGLVVDGVEEVINVAPSDIEEPPSFGSQMSTEYIMGMAKIKGTVKTLLNINRVLSDGSGAVQAGELSF